MSAIEVHGLRVATGGSIENMVMERLAADPTPIVPGRVWYNETEKVMKFSSLNGTGAVVVETFSTAGELAAYIESNDEALAKEVEDRASADTALDGRLDVVEGTGAGSVAKALADAQSYADTKIADLVDGAPELLDTLKELSAALANDADFAATVASDIAAAKAELIGTADGLNDTMGELSGRIDAADTAHTDGMTAVREEFAAGDTALGERIDTLEGSVGGATGDNNDLTTDAKLNLVAAINEVDTNADANASALSTLSGTVTTNKEGIEEALGVETQARIDGDAAQATALGEYKTSNDEALLAEIDRAKKAEGLVTGTAFSATEDDLTKAVNKVSANLATEVTDRGDAVTGEKERAEAEEVKLSNRIAPFEGDENVVGSVANQVAVEKGRAEGAEEALGTRIDNVLSNIDPQALDSITEVITAFEGADSDVMEQVTQNGSNVSTLRGEMDIVNGGATVAGSIAHSVGAEKSRAMLVEGALTGSGFSVTENDLTKAINKVSTDLGAEVTARGEDVSAEEGRAIEEETRIEGLVTAEAGRAADEEIRIEGKVDTEVEARAAADAQIRSDINAGRHAFQSATAALVHTVAHDLNSGSIVFNVMTEGTDGVYRNDLAPVTEVDANTLKVELSNARNVKVSVIDLSAI